MIMGCNTNKKRKFLSFEVLKLQSESDITNGNILDDSKSDETGNKCFDL